MRVLVTGGAGFIGSHIAEEITKQGKRVIVVDNLSNGTTDNFGSWWDDDLCTFIEADISSPTISWLRHYLRGVDVVFHEACSKCTICRDNPYKDLQTNAWGSWNIFNMARQAKVKKIVHASTGSTLDGEPVSFYGVSKLAGESYLRAFRDYYPDFQYTALRYYHVYGPRQDDSDSGGVIPIFIRHIMMNEPVTIFGDGKQVRHFTYVKDVVGVNFAVANRRRSTETVFCTDGEIFDVASDVNMSIKELASRLHHIIDKKSNIKFAPRRDGDIDTFAFTKLGIESVYGNKFVMFGDGILETIDWYREKYGK